jgi:ZIP family zinc transporter
MVAIAIAIHDIPEAVCVSAPYFLATKNRFRSFAVALSSSATTIVGFLLTYFLFRNLQPFTLGIITSATAGVMIYISVFELLPSAFDNGLARNKIIANFVAGALFVAFLHVLAT